MYLVANVAADMRLRFHFLLPDRVKVKRFVILRDTDNAHGQRRHD